MGSAYDGTTRTHAARSRAKEVLTMYQSPRVVASYDAEDLLCDAFGQGSGDVLESSNRRVL